MTLTRGRGRGVEAALAVAILAGVWAAGCGGRVEVRQGRPAGSAVWVDPREAALDGAGRRVLARAGVEEVFLEAGTLAWEGSRPVVREVPGAFQGAVTEGTPVTLVVQGLEPAGEGLEAEAAGRSLAEALRRLRLRAESAGLSPVGYHLELPEGTDPGVLRRVRAASGPDLLVSTGLARDGLTRPRARELAAASDFVVAFLYGQHPGERDDPAAWDPQRMEADLGALESLGRDYLVGLAVMGTIQRLSAAGETREAHTRAELKALAQEPALRLSIADPFAGVGRAVHSFQAQRPVRAAGWDLAPGETVRVVRTAPSLVQGLVERLRGSELPHRLGQLFYRVAAPEEALSVEPEGLAAALGTSPPVPELVARVVVDSVNNVAVMLRVELRNRSRQSTDLAATDGNYVQVRAEGGYFGRVEPGEFSRYSLWRGGREVRPGLDWREPDEVRLYTPMVRGGERIGGARIELRGRAGPTVTVGGRFFLPDGREVELDTAGGPVSRPGRLAGAAAE